MNQVAPLYKLSQSSTYWAQKTFSTHPMSPGRLCWTYITAQELQHAQEERHPLSRSENAWHKVIAENHFTEEYPLGLLRRL